MEQKKYKDTITIIGAVCASELKAGDWITEEPWYDCFYVVKNPYWNGSYMEVEAKEVDTQRICHFGGIGAYHPCIYKIEPIEEFVDKFNPVKKESQ